jgi:hypothetical protein
MFFVLVLLSCTIFAQTETKQIPQTYKFDEFGKLGETDWKTKLDSYQTELLKIVKNDEGVRAILIIYPAIREKQDSTAIIKKYAEYLYRDCRHCPFSRIRLMFVDGNPQTEEKTELWIAPNGAELPEPQK